MTHQNIQKIQVYLDTDIARAALDRIHYVITTKRHGPRVDPWHVLRWFISLATEDIAGMDARKLRERQEEFRALQKDDRITGVSYGAGPPSQEQLIEFQNTIRRPLLELRERGNVQLGPFQVDVSITVGKNRPLSSGQHLRTAFPPDLGKSEVLLYLLGWALAQCADLVQTCAWCSTLFLQQRRVRSSQRVGKYCSHYHRTLASKQRAKDDAQRQARKMNKAKQSSRRKKGAKKHVARRRKR